MSSPGQTLPDPTFDAIVIGASAGGVQALSTLLPALPAGFPVPVMIVLHIPSDRPSQLAELFAARCDVAVREAIDKEPATAGTVFFAPPDYHLLVEPDRTLALSIDTAVNYSRPSIDVLFESAAYAYGPRLLAIVLTGANDDGSAGVRTVKQHGGHIWVQDPRTASISTMPSAALQSAAADRILTLDEMVQALSQLHS